jgi:hypothetical protein
VQDVEDLLYLRAALRFGEQALEDGVVYSEKAGQ